MAQIVSFTDDRYATATAAAAASHPDAEPETINNVTFVDHT